MIFSKKPFYNPAIFLFCFLFGSIPVLGSSDLLPITILVKDHEETPLPGATVQLIHPDNGRRLAGATDQRGIIRFEEVAVGSYDLNITFIGFEPLEDQISIGSETRFFEFQLREDAVALGEVTVTARRPLIRQDGDKVIVDPEPLAGISTNTLEVLEMTPGLFVDPEGGIFLNSATPAAIYINGRLQRMSQQDINNILRSLPPGSVQRIEIIRTPSTRFDAASSGGIINIVLKQGMRIGRFGSVNTGINQGVSGNRFASVSFNDSNERITAFLNAGFNHQGVVEDLNSTRFMPMDSRLSQVSQNQQRNNSGNLGLGLTFEVNPNMTITYDGRINGGLRASNASNLNLIGFEGNPGSISENLNTLHNNGHFLTLQQDLGFTWKLDTLGSEWDTKFGYGYGNTLSEQEYTNSFMFPAIPPLSGMGDSRFGRHSFMLQSDLTLRVTDKILIETGFKSDLVDFSSSTEFFTRNNDIITGDTRRTNTFTYSERINALYAQATFTLPAQLVLKPGFRLEHTSMKGHQTIPTDTSFVVNRLDWFPFVFLSRRLFEMAGFELRGFLIYRRTIGRPDYANLNPGIRYIDPFLYETGNPALKPQFTNNIEANISFDDFPIFAVGRNYTYDIFSNVVYQDPNNPAIAVRTFDNLGKRRETYFNVAGAIPPGGRYFFAVGARYNINEFEGVYENQPLSFRRGSWMFFTFHTLRLAPNTRLTMMGFMMTNGQQNFYELDTFGQLNFGLSQTFLNQRLSITINARDVLRTMVTQFNFNQGSMHLQGDRYTDNRRFGINIRYNFGFNNRPERRNMMQFDMDE
ncbi:MAG TPA: TonB-dependent receptor [Bacteroidales bacterium]|nr:TonB-dependent receptor [Bacteroidales bacterium]